MTGKTTNTFSAEVRERAVQMVSATKGIIRPVGRLSTPSAAT